MATPHVRCPTCGRLGTASVFLRAGSHLLEVRTVLRGRGRGKGFDWSREPASVPVLQTLMLALNRALGQVQTLMDHAVAAQAAVALATPTRWVAPAPCGHCAAAVLWEPEVGRWICSGCRAVY